MEEHIIELLNSNLRVIIPEFGAFIVRQKEPRVIVFNEFLRYNDGLLIDYIAKSEQVEKEIAEQKVSDFAEEATKKIEKGNILHIKGLGSLTRDPSGKIHFTEESEQKKKAKPDAKKEYTEKSEEKPAKEKESIQKTTGDEPEKGKDQELTSQEDSQKEAAIKDEGKIDDKTKKKPEKPVGVKSQDKTATRPEIKSEAKAVSIPEDKPDQGEVETKAEIVPEAKPETKPEAKPERKPETVSESKPVPEPAGKPETKESVKRQTPGPVVSGTRFEDKRITKDDEKTWQRRTVKRTSNINQILKWILVILVVNIAILAWFLYGDQLKELFRKEKATELFADSVEYEEPAAPAAEIMEEDTSPVVEVSPVVEEPVLPPAQEVDQPRFYIVAGCFREEANADALVQSLRSKGFDAEKFGRIGNLHAVSYAAFINRADAIKELERIRQEEQPEAWMTRF